MSAINKSKNIIELCFNGVKTVKKGNQNHNIDFKNLLYSFGILSDIQYADVDDIENVRFYRNSLIQTKKAADDWNQYRLESGKDFRFILQLGDLIDGKAKKVNDTMPSMDRVLDLLNQAFIDENSNYDNQVKLYHIWGNHEMYNFQRSQIVDLSLNTARLLNQNLDSNANYYSVNLTDKLKLICLDFYKLSALGYPTDNEYYIKAMNIINEKRKNAEDPEIYLSILNGGLDETQMKWLEQELLECKNLNKKAIVSGHLPLLEASALKCIALDADKILELLWSYHDTVLAYLCGHDHSGGFAIDKYNIYHIIVPAILETPLDKNSYMTANVYNDRIILYNNSLEIKQEYIGMLD